MKKSRWQEITELYHAAMELPEKERAAFLDACTDDDLRREVSSLLANEGKADNLFEVSGLDAAARMQAKEPSSLLGRQLGSFLLVSELGSGGMGEVYLAKDRKLGRDVAIKVLPEEFAEDADRVARFQREAKLLASLNHPNIASIYDLEKSESTNFLVMELVEGQSLYDRIKSGPIPVEEVLKLALQIAEALQAAHEKGVIHRDLKPANIMVTSDGKVKVLDFGLAKAYTADYSDTKLSDSPTVSDSDSRKGVILGTAAYMSPEQARGNSVDNRTDIWAFGCVFYEMLTGQAAFSGGDATEILAAVIRAEPDWSSLPANLHWRLKEVLERCLEKEAKDRYGAVSDARVDIQKVLSDPGGMFSQSVQTVKTQKKLQAGIPWVSTVIVVAVIIAGIVGWMLKPNPKPQVTRFDYELPEGRQLSPGSSLAVSPDGRQFVYSTPDGLYLRSLDESTAKLIAGTEGGTSFPFFSPDAKWIGYFSGMKLKKISVYRGAPEILCDAPEFLRGVSWYADDTIVYSTFRDIWRVSADGGTPELLVKGKVPVVRNVQILPDGKSLLYTIKSKNLPYPRIVVKPLESGERKELLAGIFVKYLTNGYVVYKSPDPENADLFAVRFNPDSLELSGEPVPMEEDVDYAAISDSGTLVYTTETYSAAAPGDALVWVDRDGDEEQITATSGFYRGPRISPDGTKVALTVVNNLDMDIHVLDLIREDMTQITFNETIENNPLWTLDGQRIVFTSNREGKFSIYSKSADGAGETKIFCPASDEMGINAVSWAGGGNILLLQRVVSVQDDSDIEMLSMEEASKRTSLLPGENDQKQPQISPDGRWMAYVSNESGECEVYVCSFPEVREKRKKVSIGGGMNPLWSPDGKEIFYYSGDAVMAVEVQTEPAIEAGKPRFLFKWPYPFTGNDNLNPWDISPDGKRFLMIKPVEASEVKSAGAAPQKIHVVTNWLEELKERVPD